MSSKISFARTLLFYGQVIGGASALTYGYLYFRCRKLRRDAKDWDLIQAKKDTTRPNNEYYGINWGYRADNTLEKALDTGDMLFFNY